MSTDPLARWHELVRSREARALDDLLSDDVVFLSPAVHTPQVGRSLAGAYLRAALDVLGNESFRYLSEWRGERSAVLEFACTLDGYQVNGVDIVRWNEAGKITEFKVMVRPVKGLQALIARMAERLQRG